MKKHIHTTHSTEETIQFGITFSKRLKKGDIAAVTGELGSGKTTFIKGVCSGLGFKGKVSSPSFVNIHYYRGEVMIYHIDLYFNQSIEDIHDLGLEEIDDGSGIILIEWADRLPEIIPENAYRIHFQTDEKNHNMRKIIVQ